MNNRDSHYYKHQLRSRISNQLGMRDDYALDSEQLRDLVEPMIQDLDRTLEPDPDKARKGATTNGAIEVLSRRVAETLGHLDDSPARRIYDLRYKKTRKTPYRFAEALLDALGSHITHHDLMVFPGGSTLAREIADTWLEDATLAERKRFARSLHHFTLGFFNGEPAFEELPVEEAEQMELIAA